MQNRKSQIIRRSGAFTLIELLLVVGIIGILVALLVPTVAKVRIAGQKVVTQGLINRLTAACEAYYQDYNAYPGPLAEDDLVSADMTSANVNTRIPQLGTTGLDLKYPSPAGSTTYVKLDHAVTSSENLFLGLCGGLRYDQSSPANFIYDEDLAKRMVGPQSLRTGLGKKPQPYLQVSLAEISASADSSNPLNSATGSSTPGLWWDSSNGYMFQSKFLGDSRIFEFVDAFKIRRPILYMRARKGVTRANIDDKDVTAFIRRPNIPSATMVTEPFQYDPTQIQYTYSNTGIDKVNMIDRLGAVWNADTLDYPKIPDETGTKTKIDAGDEHYFANTELSTGNAKSMSDATKSLVPLQKDKFILISAGPDGIYGTADDIRN